MAAPTPTRIGYTAAGWRDLAGGLRHWPLWGRMGWEDIRQRYRRSVLGPFWFSLSMLVMVVSLGFFYSRILHQNLHDYLPFLTLGFLFWGMMSDMITGGCTAFIVSETLIRQIKLPLSIHVYRAICRQFLIFLHNLVIYIPIMLVFRIWPGAMGLLLLPGLALWLINAAWLELLLSLCSTRFRDVPPLIGSLTQIIFFLSPILWHPDTLGDLAGWVEFNPVYHFLEIVRAPLLGIAPDPLSWIAAIGITAVGWGVTFPIFARFRSRIAYWL